MRRKAEIFASGSARNSAGRRLDFALPPAPRLFDVHKPVTCACRGDAKRRLSYQDKHTSRLQMVVLVPIKDEYGSLNVGFEKLVQAHLKACHSSGFMIQYYCSPHRTKGEDNG